jgi:predicted nicotinamide N-methyase
MDRVELLRTQLGRPLECARVPLCPELSLWLLSGEIDTDTTCAELAELEHPPYWAFCWIGGQALARYLLDHPEEVRGRHVVDFGAGSGIAGIAAARAGARSVTAVDTDPAALCACAANARLNSVEIELASALPERWDLLLAADVLYDADARARLREPIAAGARILIGDPERAPEHRIDEVCSATHRIDCIEARTYPDVDGPKRCAFIYALGPAPALSARP